MTEVPSPTAVSTDDLTGELDLLRRGVLSLGSNLGDRLGHLQEALDALIDTPDFWVREVSPVYETVGVGTPEGSGLFLNIVLVFETTLGSSMLLDRLLTIEDTLGRVRTGLVNGPRTLDIDVITFADKVSADPKLTLPHPRAHERAFVLQPWHDVEPDASLPGHGPIAVLLESVDRSGIALRDDLVLER